MRPVGLGLQFEVSAGGISTGFEVVIYWDEDVCKGDSCLITYYTYSGMELSAESMLLIDNLLYELGKFSAEELGSMDQDFLLMVGAALIEGVSASGGVFVIDGNDSFKDAIDYSGAFDSVSVMGTFNGKRAGMYMATSDTCTAVGLKIGIGAPAPRLLPIDISYSRTIYSEPIELLRW